MPVTADIRCAILGLAVRLPVSNSEIIGCDTPTSAASCAAETPAFFRHDRITMMKK
jgi:hypothetical protein